VPRTKAFQPAQALDRAMELFWRDGYAATGLDQLVRRTGASRYGLYATFGGKRDLFVASLERWRTPGRPRARSGRSSIGCLR